MKDTYLAYASPLYSCGGTNETVCLTHLDSLAWQSKTGLLYWMVSMIKRVLSAISDALYLCFELEKAVAMLIIISLTNRDMES